MGYRNLQQCVSDLEQHGHLIRCTEPVHAYLEIAEIQRRIYLNQGPAILFTNVIDCEFPMLGNLFGSMPRVEFMFRHTLESVRRAIELKIDPNSFFRNPTRYWSAPFTAWRMQPKMMRSAPILQREITISQLPQLVSWPRDAGAFVTLPQVYTEHPATPGWQKSNLGMYRIQLSGNRYTPNREVGMHYQIHRGIGVHHQAALERNEPLKVNVFVGGHPAMTLSAVMPLPEGLSELTFAGALAGHRIPLVKSVTGLPMYGEADFCISGTVAPQVTKPEGPFGDHLGYYSLEHEFPVLNVEKVYCRKNAIWPFTVVGRPPQEDTSFGAIIHEITGPIIPTVLPGVKEVHAVDAAGVHPLLLAIGSERYMPFMPLQQPQELLTQANAILGQGQMSLAKYLWIMNAGDNSSLNLHDTPQFFKHMLERIDWQRDCHFHTKTTIDTLDYSGTQLNAGSKVVFAAVGAARRQLATEIPANFSLPEGFSKPRVCLPGVLAIEAPPYSETSYAADCARITQQLPAALVNAFPLLVLVNDSEFTARNLNNFLWVTFTRSNPAADIHGVAEFTQHKHWGCAGSLVIDARLKPHHAPPLIEDAAITEKINQLALRGGPLAKYLTI
jgi:4-hydroxy-3-polyprenylbenzoate decarboxylase